MGRLTIADIRFALCVLLARVLLTIMIVICAFAYNPHYLITLGALWLTWRVRVYLGWV